MRDSQIIELLQKRNEQALQKSGAYTAGFASASRSKCLTILTTRKNA